MADYDFILLHTSGKRNPTDGPSRRLDYAENPLPTGSLIPPQALRLLPTIANLIGVHAALVFNHRFQILASYDTDAVAQQHLSNPMSSNWSYKDGLLLYKGLIYVPETRCMDVLREHHDAPLAGHCGIAVSAVVSIISSNGKVSLIQRTHGSPSSTFLHAGSSRNSIVAILENLENLVISPLLLYCWINGYGLFSLFL